MASFTGPQHARPMYKIQDKTVFFFSSRWRHKNLVPPWTERYSFHWWTGQKIREMDLALLVGIDNHQVNTNIKKLYLHVTYSWNEMSGKLSKQMCLWRRCHVSNVIVLLGEIVALNHADIQGNCRGAWTKNIVHFRKSM